MLPPGSERVVGRTNLGGVDQNLASVEQRTLVSP
jgi:hypothetical protein